MRLLRHLLTDKPQVANAEGIIYVWKYSVITGVAGQNSPFAYSAVDTSSNVVFAFTANSNLIHVFTPPNCLFYLSFYFIFKHFDSFIHWKQPQVPSRHVAATAQ